MKRLFLSVVLAIACTGCATLERGADHVRDFSAAHPIVTKAALVVGTAAVTTIVVRKIAKTQFEEQVRRMEEMQ